MVMSTDGQSLSADAPSHTLADGQVIPWITVGPGLREDRQATEMVAQALDVGYRSIDTASLYGNAAAIGRAVSASGIDREDVTINTKIRGYDQGHLKHTKLAVTTTLRELRTEYIDVALIHWPLPALDLALTTFEALLRLREDGYVHSVGVSNFTASQIRCIQERTGEWPVLNQVQLSPTVAQAGLRRALSPTPVRIQSYRALETWSGILHSRRVLEMAAAHGKSPTQILLRWQRQIGTLPVIAATDRRHLRENLDTESFRLTDEEMGSLEGLDRGSRYAPNSLTHFEL